MKSSWINEMFTFKWFEIISNCSSWRQSSLVRHRLDAEPLSNSSVLDSRRCGGWSHCIQSGTDTCFKSFRFFCSSRWPPPPNDDDDACSSSIQFRGCQRLRLSQHPPPIFWSPPPPPASSLFYRIWTDLYRHIDNARSVAWILFVGPAGSRCLLGDVLMARHQMVFGFAYYSNIGM